MTTLYYDLETFSATPIRAGTYRYARDTEVMLVAWAIDDGPVRVDEGIGEDFKNAFLSCDELVAHNAQFDRVVLAAHGLKRDIKAHRCTMAQALAHSLPGGLDALCTLLKVPQDQAKQKNGKQLVQLFCKPRPKNMKLRRATYETHPDEWLDFCKYAAQDVEAMRVVRQKMPTWNYKGEHLTVWHLDQLINDRGVAVDLGLSQAAVELMASQHEKMAEETALVTEGEVESATKRAQLLKYILKEHGVSLPDMKAATLERRVNDETLPQAVRDLIALRLESALTSGKKHKVVLASHTDGRLRGLLQFCGAARTGRWSGRVFQPQNLPRPPKYLDGDAYDAAVEAIKNGTAATDYDSPLEVVSATVRAVLVAPPGKKLLVSDLSAIEGRCLAWLAGERWALDAYASGQDMYKLAYSMSFDVPMSEVGDAERQIGKVQVLALGYQGAVGAVRAMAGDKADKWTDKYIVDGIVKPWRAANPNIVRFWYALEDAARQAVTYPGVPYVVGMLKLQRDGAWLRIRLPSGRCLCYPQPALEDGVVSYMGVNQYTRRWERLTTYGGKLAENVTQAVARDILAHGLLKAERAAYCPVLTVHDEVICEVPNTDAYTVEQLIEFMADSPPWAGDLVLAAAGFECTRYRK
ncbi:MAG: DNA polymerase [Burkholderiaceae bacterium]|nr:DNA polymerase [Burkholderiaceae bacterium]